MRKASHSKEKTSAISRAFSLIEFAGRGSAALLAIVLIFQYVYPSGI